MIDNKLITIFGGSGFLGRYVAQNLLNAGARVRIAVRNPLKAQFIKPMGGLGQTQFIACDVANPSHVEAAIKDSDIVINMVGILKGNFQKYHVEGPRNIARAAAEHSVEKLIHISAIGADLESPSRYGQSRAEGEQALLKAYPHAIILRPSIIFGREDNFLNQFAAMIAKFPIIPIIGGDTKFQPIYAPDVAKAVTKIASEAGHDGKIYEFGGPQIITMRALNEWIASATGHTPVFMDIPDVATSILTTVTGWLPAAPITKDQFKMLGSDNIVNEDLDGIKALGLTVTPLEVAQQEWFNIYRKNGRFGNSAKA